MSGIIPWEEVRQTPQTLQKDVAARRKKDYQEAQEHKARERAKRCRPTFFMTCKLHACQAFWKIW